MKTIDCKGLACPAPVLAVKEAIDQKGLKELCVFVDNDAAKENVSRFLGSHGFVVSYTRENNDYEITGKKDESSSSCEIIPEADPSTEHKKIMVMVATDRIGHGDDELGSKLMASFLKTLKEMGEELWRLVFVNNGVKLTIEGSGVISDLKELDKDGTHILVCGTCLNHFDLMDKKQVGETTNMLDIVTSLQLADKVINI